MRDILKGLSPKAWLMMLQLGIRARDETEILSPEGARELQKAGLSEIAQTAALWRLTPAGARVAMHMPLDAWKLSTKPN